MPSTSPKQAAFMRAVAHNADFARKVDVRQSVAHEFTEADKRKALIEKLKGPRKPYRPATGGVRG